MTTARPVVARGLFGNSIALLATAQLTAVFGYAFWMICARVFSAGVIGVTNTVIAAMTLIAMLTVSGFVPMLTRSLPGATPAERSGLCSTAFLLTACISGTAGVAAALILPDHIRAAVGTGWLVILLGAGTVCTSMLLVVSAALLGIRRAELSLIGDVAGSVTRLSTVGAFAALGLLAAGVAATGARTILGIWITSLFLSVCLSLSMLARTIPDFRFTPGVAWFSRVKHSVGWDHIATLAVRTPPFLIPILASAVFASTELGYLAVTAMIATAFFAVGAAVSNALLADCADDPARLWAQTRKAIRLISLLLFIPVVFACIFAKQVLGLFGPGYAEHSPLLIVLLLATFPDAVTNIAVAILRVHHRLRIVAALTMVGATLSIGGAWILMKHIGVLGAGIAICGSQLVVALAFCAMGLRYLLTDSDTAPVDDATSPTDGDLLAEESRFSGRPTSRIARS